MLLTEKGILRRMMGTGMMNSGDFCERRVTFKVEDLKRAQISFLGSIIFFFL